MMDKRKKLKKLEKVNRKRAASKKHKKLRRREAIRSKRKYEKEIEEDVSVNKKKPRPFINPHKQRAKIRERLEHNIEILKAMEEEYIREMSEKKSRNEVLESEGYKTFREKMDAINEQAMEDLAKIDEIEKEQEFLERMKLEDQNQEQNKNPVPKKDRSKIIGSVGGSAECVARDKDGNVLHTSGLDDQEDKNK